MTTSWDSLLVLSPADRAAQTTIRLPLPIVEGNCDYKEREELLIRMHEILVSSGLEAAYIAKAVAADHAESEKMQIPLTDRRRDTIQHYTSQALRCTIARILSNESLREFSCHLAESPLLQWFCTCSSLGVIKVPTKSTLQRMASEVPADMITELNAMLLHSAAAVDTEGDSQIGLEVPADLSMIWMDSTCAKLNIHYPADWTLLRDATRSIMKSISVIRGHGLKHRMRSPSSFIAEMNRHAMAISGASRRGRGGNKKSSRKQMLRAMKRLVKKVQRHGENHSLLLKTSWQDTDLTEPQAAVIWKRIDTVVEALPAAIKQAHDRIIGERVIPNGTKILSLYEPHCNVYVRGKAGADVEFGLQLLVSESAEGLIVDCLLVPDGVRSDTKLLVPAIKRIKKEYGPDAAAIVVTDRGFSSAANSETLATMGVADSTLPRAPRAMEAKLKEPGERVLHQRRAQTEARIGVFKANFLGDHLPTKGLKAQERYVAWCCLAHNLWVLGRMEVARNAAQKSA